MTQTRLTSDPKPLYTIDQKKAHTVYKNKAGKRVPGVTTILGIQAKPHLIKWANDLGLEGIDSSKFASNAADIGTIAHALMECHLTGQDLDEANLSPADVDRAQNAFLKFIDWWEREGFTVVHSELKMVSERFQAGGTADIIARDRDGNLVLIDLKTSKGIYKDHRVQASTYAEMYEESETEPAEPIDRIIIARFGKEEVGDFEVREVFDRTQCVEHFESLRRAYETDKAVKP